MPDTDQTNQKAEKFDFSSFPDDTLFYDRRSGLERRAQLQAERAAEVAAGTRRAKKERRRRVDPTTFEKQYSADEMEFMTAMQEFKSRTGKAFPSYAEVLGVARSLGYERISPEESREEEAIVPPGPSGDSLISLPFVPTGLAEGAR